MVSYVRSRFAEAGAMDAEDLVQDVMVSIFQRLDLSVPVEEMAGYVYRSLKNRVLDAYRRRKEEVGIGEREFEDEHSVSPPELLEEFEFLNFLDRSLDTLPPPMRAVFQLVELEGRTHKEAAEILEIPVGTALTWNREARRRLKEELKIFK